VTGQSVARREIAVDANGLITEAAVAQALEGCAGQRALVCLQMANNETGVIQSVAALSQVAKAHGADVFCDAVQAAGRLPIDMAALGVDALAVSAHKLGVAAGTGALVVRPGFEVRALVRGGGQERGRRGGSENVAGISAFGAAARAAKAGLTEAHGIAALRDRLEAEVLRSRGGGVLIGQGVPRLSNTSVIVGPIKAETMVIRMDLAGVSISAGAACSSGKVGRSATLAAMGLADEVAARVIRVSLGWTTTERDIEAFLAVWRAIAGDADEASSGPGGAIGATRVSTELMGV
jgi:cysteine desulfurase